jgi:hypothetical protein
LVNVWNAFNYVYIAMAVACVAPNRSMIRDRLPVHCE